MTPELQGNLLLVDDEVLITRALHHALRTSLGHQVSIETCNDGQGLSAN